MNKEKKKRFPIGICLLICVVLLAGVILTLALIGAGKREKKEAASEPETTEAPQIPEQHYFDFLM